MKQSLNRQINWFIDFARLNLGDADMGQLSKLRTELAQIFLTGKVGRPAAPLNEVQYAELIFETEQRYFGTKDKIRNLQQTILSHIEKITDGIERVARKAELEWISYEDSQTLSGVDLISSKIHLDFEIKALLFPARDYEVEAGNSKTRWKETWRTQSSFLILTLPTGNPEDTLLFRFSQLLEAVPINAFRRCKSCGKVFFHISKREKIYCSNLCAAKAGNKRKRESIKESDPALYQRQRRRAGERAQKSYEKKVMEKYPKAKIQHRKTIKRM